MNPQNNPLAEEFRLEVSRVLRVPISLVFRAWTDPAQLSQWFSPEGTECRSVSAEVRVGGVFRIHMASAKGDHIAYGNYRQVLENQRLQFTWHWENYPMPNSLITVDFQDLGAATRITLLHEGLPDQEDVREHNRGWSSLLDKFAQLMEQK